MPLLTTQPWIVVQQWNNSKSNRIANDWEHIFSPRNLPRTIAMVVSFGNKSLAREAENRASKPAGAKLLPAIGYSSIEEFALHSPFCLE
jgi:hypothetical protein